MVVLMVALVALFAGFGCGVVVAIEVFRRDLPLTWVMAARGRARGEERWGYGAVLDVPHTLPGRDRLTVVEERHDLQRVWAELS